MNAVPLVVTTPKRRKWFWRVLWAFFALIVGVCLFWTRSYYSALAERDSLIAEIRAKGEPVWWSEVVSGLTPVGEDVSGAPWMLKAMWEMGWPFDPEKPSLHSPSLTSLRQQEVEPRILPEVQQALRSAEKAFALAEQAVQRKPGLVGGFFLKPESTSLDDIDGIHAATDLLRMLRWRIWDALARGDSATVYRSARQSLAVSNQLQNEPLLCLQVIRLGLVQGACECAKLCANYSSVPEDEFVRLDSALAAADADMKFNSVLIGERAWRIAVLGDSDDLAKQLSEWNDYSVRRGVPITRVHRKWADVVASKAGLPARIKSQTALIRLIEEFRKEIDHGPMEQSKVDELCKDFERESAIHRLIEGSEDFEIDFLRDFPNRVTFSHRRLLFARLALRLRRHYDKHGRLPQTLSELCDDAMPTIPWKWFFDKPITYKATAKGFRLEVPESIVPPEERAKIRESPIGVSYGLEIEFKTIKPAKDDEK